MSFYQNYIYYLIPYNPLAELDTNLLDGYQFIIDYLNGNTSSKISYNLNNNTLILKYFSDLKLVSLKEKTHCDINYNHENDTHFSYHFQSGLPTYDFLINEAFLCLFYKYY